jgi:Flp pilus assembly protein TadG
MKNPSPNLFRSFRWFALSNAGTSAIEFALLAPTVLLLMFGITQIGLSLFNYISLADAVSTGTRTFAMSRGSASPLTATKSIMQAAAANLASANLSITLSVNGVTCATDAACATALVSGQPAKVAATYPCSVLIMGVNFAPGCTLSSSTTGRVE